MTDSGAVRQARYKRHKAGDHSLCRHDRPVVRITLPETAQDPAQFDPDAEMRRLAGRLAGAHRQDPGNAAIARELRITLLVLPPPPEGPDEIDLLNMRRASRRLDPDMADLFRELGR